MRLVLMALLGAFFGAGAYTFWYGEGFSYLTDDPLACKNCHIMNQHYDGWLKSSHHAVASCNDCHLPRSLVLKYLIKMENGFWHSKSFTLQDFHEPIQIRPHNRTILNDNCRACHLELVSELIVSHGKDEFRLDCLRCHASVGHGAVW